jgi:hypothetical protein
MKTYSTTAYEAEKELDNLLGHENRIYKPWQLDNHLMEPVKIKATTDEMLLLTFANAYVRPSFEASETKVQVPNLFCKLNGAVHGFLLDMKAKAKQYPDLIAVYQGYQKMNRKPRTNFLSKKPSWFNDTLGINVDQALKDDIKGIKHLKPMYQRAYLHAINRVLNLVRTSAFTGEAPTSREVLETLLYNSRKITEMMHAFDYQYTVPKFTVIDNQKKSASPYAVVRLLMMNALGFDVFIVSEDGYSSLENYVSNEIVDVHHLTENEFKYSEVMSARAKSMKKLFIATTVLTLVAIGFFALSIL